MRGRELLHGGEKRVAGDAGYQGAGKRPENAGLEVEWEIAKRISLLLGFANLLIAGRHSTA